MTRTSISQPIWWHPIARASCSSYKPPGDGWERFDSTEEFNCFAVIDRVINQIAKEITLYRQKNILLQEVYPYIQYKIDFCLEVGKKLIFIKYKGDWVRASPSASTLLNYQLALLFPKCSNFLLVSKMGTLLPKRHWAKSHECSLKTLELRLRTMIME